MAKRSWINPITIVVVVLTAAAVYLFGFPPETKVEEGKEQSVPVKTQTAEISEFRDTIEALGTAMANETVRITAQTQDVVEKIYFESGDLVEQGQLLAELNARIEVARVQQLKFSLDEAKRQLERITELRRGNAASQQQLNEQQVRVNGLQADLEVAEATLKEMKIYAPFSGRVGIREISAGSLVSPGDVFTTLDDIKPIKVDFSVPERYFASIAVDQEVIARSRAYPGEQFIGRISSIDSRVDPVTRSVKVRAKINNDDERLRPGMLLQITLLRSIDEALLLPEKALIPIQNRQYVYVLTPDNRARQKEVTIGRRKPGIVEITGGLKPGEEVIIEGIVRLRDGVPVSVQGG
ncbi:efflux RND transporter periplasmic adaptor subunit [Idiomarina loihiensis]|mgnify:FL=1|jgi:membrane fusion protein (multidrug efflux system)|uniref:HlyD family secretion protein n=1 Tax=Idiomarina loihiensis (strain ATCC BAA-735 / DSM 15497 / L2-TR) TaxID=283942 RepID=Q5QVV7_IDILO|nr:MULTISPECIES: efflux RND transporter periplasmic adaptor subunit [Idiomarina]MAA62079.1 MexH family multidrug efflux RND transporter periplasmic adaptor subunit [Idiomarina sp.]NWO03677.1 efflux RND transporter periplasmic adaptor subunit [Idiomarinaceae bacterium]AAV83137.1 HlyD family secretion protein [Idiomarina loihiensis L2TR]AGM37182.1 HlyD family secretion protein [Idiomarina loihiensis GSL 199]MBL4857508.1 efflux RND transporter periplasmic adaptor subunit [Idiomarina sp.]|tara:strand:- start:7101 stop:8156 length:1056 start_codon:yes stop_codon:yes gene_type:complete